MALKVFADRLSQPSRAILIFCKANKIDFEEVKVELLNGQHLTPEFKEINPMGQVPAIMFDGKFKLFESHAILIFLAAAFPGVADHWNGEFHVLVNNLVIIYVFTWLDLHVALVARYPSDIYKRAEIHSILDWHHSNLRCGSVGFILNAILAPVIGQPLNPQAAAECEKVLCSSLSRIETVWLKESGQFLLGNTEPSIADLSLVCEIMELELADEADRSRILGPYKKVQQWIEATKNAIMPHFDEVHEYLLGAKTDLQMQQ